MQPCPSKTLKLVGSSVTCLHQIMKCIQTISNAFERHPQECNLHGFKVYFWVNVTDAKCPMWVPSTLWQGACFLCSNMRNVAHPNYSIFKLSYFPQRLIDHHPSVCVCGLGRFHFPAPLRSYLNGLYNNLLCPQTTQQIIILCSNLWQEKLVTITKRAGVFLFPTLFLPPPSPRARSRKGCVQG